METSFEFIKHNNNLSDLTIYTDIFCTLNVLTIPKYTTIHNVFSQIGTKRKSNKSISFPTHIFQAWMKPTNVVI